MPIARVLLVALFLVGCSGRITNFAPPSLLPTAIPTATPVPHPSPIAMVIQQGRLYLASDERLNGRLCLFNSRWAGSTNWRAMAAAIEKLAGVYRTSADTLRAVAWTKGVRHYAIRLIGSLAATEAAMRAQAAASDREAFRKLARIVFKLNLKAIGDSNAVRGALRLDSVTGDPCNV